MRSFLESMITCPNSREKKNQKKTELLTTTQRPANNNRHSPDSNADIKTDTPVKEQALIQTLKGGHSTKSSEIDCSDSHGATKMYTARSEEM